MSRAMQQLLADKAVSEAMRGWLKEMGDNINRMHLNNEKRYAEIIRAIGVEACKPTKQKS